MTKSIDKLAPRLITITACAVMILDLVFANAHSCYANFPKLQVLIIFMLSLLGAVALPVIHSCWYLFGIEYECK